jgi:hypothetical protein
MKHRNYKVELLALFAAVFVSVASFVGDYFCLSLNLFARSGAIIVLVAVFVEYKTGGHIYEDIQRAQFLQSTINASVPLKESQQEHVKKFLMRLRC